MKGLVLIYLITALGSAGALVYPVIGLMVYVLFAVLRPQFIWGFAGNFDGISYTVGIATLIGWLVRGFGNLRIGPGKWIVASLVAFALWSVASASQAVDPDIAYAELYPMAKFVIPFIIGVTVLDSERLTKMMMWTIVVAQGYVGFEMNLAYLKGYNIAGEGFGGMDNNCFGVALVTTIGPAVALAVGAKRWWEKLLAMISVAFILHTTLLTFSRGAMLGLIVVGLTAFVIMPKRPKYIAALVVVGLIAARLTGPQLAARYSTALASEEDRDGSAQSRVDLWRDCIKVAAEKPIFGIGPGNFRVIAADLGWTAGKQAHSTWMQTLAENGIPGFVFLLFFFLVAAFKLWPLARMKQTEENAYRVVMASSIVMSIVGFAVSGQFVSLAGLEIPYYMVMIGVVLLRIEREKAAQAVPVPALPTTAPRRPLHAMLPRPMRA